MGAPDNLRLSWTSLSLNRHVSRENIEGRILIMEKQRQVRVRNATHILEYLATSPQWMRQPVQGPLVIFRKILIFQYGFRKGDIMKTQNVYVVLWRPSSLHAGHTSLTITFHDNKACSKSSYKPTYIETLGCVNPALLQALYCCQRTNGTPVQIQFRFRPNQLSVNRHVSRKKYGGTHFSHGETKKR